MKRNGNAELRRQRRRGGCGLGSRYPLPVGEGAVSLPINFFDVFVWQWCILGAYFNVSIRHVKQSKASFVCQLPIGQLSHLADVSSMISHINNTYIRVRSQPDRHTCSLYYGHSRHARTCYHLSLYRPTTFMHFISRDSGSKQISFITEGLPWKITVNNWSIQKKNNGNDVPVV